MEVKTVDLTVVTVPKTVMFECPHCKLDFEREYFGFCADIGEPCDWKFSKFECPECGKEMEVEDVDWD